MIDGVCSELVCVLDTAISAWENQYLHQNNILPARCYCGNKDLAITKFIILFYLNGWPWISYSYTFTGWPYLALAVYVHDTVPNLGVDLNISDVGNLKVTDIYHINDNYDMIFMVERDNRGQTYFRMIFNISGWIRAADVMPVSILTWYWSRGTRRN